MPRPACVGILRAEHIKSYCVLDSDYHTSEQIAERYTEAAAHNIQLRVWTRKEIENYLLIPMVIHRLICDGVAANVTPPTLAEVESAMEHFIDGLRDEVFDALSTELLSQDKAGGVAKANRLARETITKAWATVNGRLAIIPGKRMISLLSGWSQTIYGPSFNALRVASTLRCEEIHPEVRAVIEAIEEHEDIKTP